MMRTSHAEIRNGFNQIVTGVTYVRKRRHTDVDRTTSTHLGGTPAMTTLRRNVRRTVATTIITAATAGTLAACGGNANPPLPKPSSKAAAPLSKQQALHQATQVVASYDKATTSLWNNGKANAANKRLLARYWVNVKEPWTTLKWARSMNITRAAAPTVLSTKPVSYTANPGKITIWQCLDYAKATSKQGSKKLSSGKLTKLPRLVTLSRTDGSWKLTSDTNDIHGSKAAAQTTRAFKAHNLKVTPCRAG